MSDAAVYGIIVITALLTYGLRAGGLLLAGRMPRSKRMKRFTDALPGTILLSLVVPGALSSGISGLAGTVLTLVCTARTGNVFVAMLVGTALVAVCRQMGL